MAGFGAAVGLVQGWLVLGWLRAGLGLVSGWLALGWFRVGLGVG